MNNKALKSGGAASHSRSLAQSYKSTSRVPLLCRRMTRKREKENKKERKYKK